MADLLRSGHTMLNLACPICNNPIFKNKEEKLFCPICNREVIIVENKNQPDKNLINERQIKNQVNNITEKDREQLITMLKQVIYEKLNLIIKKLKSETQIDKIEKYLNLLMKCFDLLNNKIK